MERENPFTLLAGDLPVASGETELIADEQDSSFRRDSNEFLLTGAVSLSCGIGLFITILVGSPYLYYSIFMSAGVLAMGYGITKLVMRGFLRKKLALPALTLRRKETATPARQPEAFQHRRLVKLHKDRFFLGVASGLAQYAEVSSTAMRVVFIASFFFSAGFSFFIYLILGMVLPAEE